VDLKQLSDRIADDLIEDIRNDRIAEGSPLPAERQLCVRFSTSRPTVRTAIMAMQARGYASLSAARRPRAAKPSIGGVFETAGESLRELLGDTTSSAYLDQVRQFIEMGAVRAAAQDASNIQIAQIHSALEAGYDALGDDLAFASADAAFHRAIVAVIQNPIILELHDRFVLNLVTSRPTPGEQVPRNRKSYEEHRQIYEAIVDNDSETAVSIMERHLARSYRASLARPKKLNNNPEE